MSKISFIKDKDYINWIEELKDRYRISQIKAAIKVNSELINFNWLLGKDIVDRKADAKWGSSFFETLSADLKRFFPNSGGFSVSNLRYMKRFYLLFPESIRPQLEGETPNNISHPQVGTHIFMMPWNHIKINY